MQKCETYVKRGKSETPIKWVPSRNISSGYYNRDYRVDLRLSIVVRLRDFLLSGLKKKIIWCYKLQPFCIESAHVAHAIKMIDSLIHYYSGGGVVVSQKTSWIGPQNLKKNITPVLVLQVASKRGTRCAAPRRKRPARPD